MKLIKKYEEFIRYIIIGGLTTLVSLGVYYLLVYTILNPDIPFELQLTNIISWIVSVTFAYFTNRSFVFKSRDKSNFKEVLEFYLSRVSTLVLEMILMYLLVTVLHFNDKIFIIIAQVIVILANYILSKFIVFKKR